MIEDRTLTGKPSVLQSGGGGIEENDLLRLTASLERSSEHPLAAAIVRSANERGLSLAPVENFDSPVGKGVTGSVEGRKLVIGNLRIMTEASIDASGLDKIADDFAARPTPPLRCDRRQGGRLLAIADPIRRPPARSRLKAAASASSCSPVTTRPQPIRGAEIRIRREPGPSRGQSKVVARVRQKAGGGPGPATA